MNFRWYALVFLIVSSCSNRMPKPDNLISEDMMADILTDLSLIDASQGINKTILEANGVESKAYILKKYNVDSLQFASSNEYYSNHIKVYQRIRNKQKARLNAKKTVYKKIEAEEKKEKKRQDSIRRSRNRKPMDTSNLKEHPKDNRTQKKPTNLLKTIGKQPE